MTTEQLRDNIMMEIKSHVGASTYSIINVIVNDNLRDLRIESATEIATVEEDNTHYVELFAMLKLSKKTKQTAKAYLYSLKLFKEFIGGKSLVNVTSLDVECFLAYLSKTNGAVSVNSHKRNISAFYAWLVTKQYMTFNPCAEVESYPEEKKLIDHLEPEEVERLKDACQCTRDRAILEFLRCTGARVGEVITLNINDIDFAHGELIIHGEKNKTDRWAFLDRTAIGYIRQYVYSRGLNEMSNEPLFAVDRAPYNRLSRRGFEYTLNVLGEKSEINHKVYPHIFRKTLATTVIRRGGTMDDAGLIIGHTPSGVTATYYGARDKRFARTIFERYVAVV